MVHDQTRSTELAETVKKRDRLDWIFAIQKQNMRIGLVSGFWGQNIGNAFFNLGGKACLEAAGHDGAASAP